MPELPEVETARSLIADEALNRLIVDADDSDTFVCRPHSPGELRDALIGRTLTAAHRRGKAISRPGIPAAPARAAAPRCGTERSAAAPPGGALASRPPRCTGDYRRFRNRLCS